MTAYGSPEYSGIWTSSKEACTSNSEVGSDNNSHSSHAQKEAVYAKMTHRIINLRFIFFKIKSVFKLVILLYLFYHLFYHLL